MMVRNFIVFCVSKIIFSVLAFASRILIKVVKFLAVIFTFILNSILWNSSFTFVLFILHILVVESVGITCIYNNYAKPL